jgi:hypothetical protein
MIQLTTDPRPEQVQTRLRLSRALRAYIIVRLPDDFELVPTTILLNVRLECLAAVDRVVAALGKEEES